MMKKIEEKAEVLIRKYNMIGVDDVVVAGVSGGADSVCLLFVLCRLSKKYHFSVKACHVNHGLRGADADEDERFVEELCREWNVPCRVFHENVELIARKRKQSTEEAGRTARRMAFETMCREDGGTKIAAAHHCNDNAETMLLNIARGTGLGGLCGIRPVCGRWIRPLLGVSREEIVSALTEAGIPWREDLSNAEDIYTRNRIRHNIIPLLCSQVNPETVLHLSRLSRQAAEVWDYVMQGVETAWGRCVTVCGESASALEIRKDEFEKEMPAIRNQLIHRCICEAAGMNRDVEAVHVSAVTDLFGRQTGRKLCLPYGVTAYRVYGGVRLKKEADSEPLRGAGTGRSSETTGDTETVLKIPGEVSVPGRTWRISCRVYERKEADNGETRLPQKSYTKCFDYDIIKHTVSVRNRRPGDYLVIGKNGNRQKLKSYFVNEKVPSGERGNLLLIADGSHIMWIPGMRMSARYQITGDTKRILEIKITEDEKNGRESQSSDPGGRSGSENQRTGGENQ